MTVPRRNSALLVRGLAAATMLGLPYAFVVGCGSSSQEPPPNTTAQAESTGAGGHHHLPPPEAFDACKGKVIDDACSVQMADREITGKCASPPPGSAQTTPACRPEGGARHRGGHHGPPPEKVFAACDGKAAGDECSVEFEKGALKGACLAPRHADAGAERLLCAPAHPHKREGGSPNAGGK